MISHTIEIAVTNFWLKYCNIADEHGYKKKENFRSYEF